MKIVRMLFIALTLPIALLAQEGTSTDTAFNFTPLRQMLSTKPYVEQECRDTVFEGWPYKAKICTYSINSSPIGKNLHVIVADASIDQLQSWVTDAGDQIEAVKYLKKNDHVSYVKALCEIGRYIKGQSSFIFPLDGEIWEDMEGDGTGYIYLFKKGVTNTGRATGGTYCRILSIRREDYANYLVSQDSTLLFDKVLEGIHSYKNWCDKCMEMYKEAWTSSNNEAFRAKALNWNKSFMSKNPDYKTLSTIQILEKFKEAIRN